MTYYKYNKDLEKSIDLINFLFFSESHAIVILFCFIWM